MATAPLRSDDVLARLDRVDVVDRGGVEAATTSDPILGAVIGEDRVVATATHDAVGTRAGVDVVAAAPSVDLVFARAGEQPVRDTAADHRVVPRTGRDVLEVRPDVVSLASLAVTGDP